MAQINVTELLSDPDFVDPISVITRIPRVDSLGQVSFQEQVQLSAGSVQPASFKVIQKLPEAFRVANVSSFWFKGMITATAPGRYSSILVFRGVRYQVQTVADYTNFGEGYTEGTCIAEILS